MNPVETLANLEREIRALQAELLCKQQLLSELRREVNVGEPCKYSKVLSTDEITRYSRQIIMPQVTLNGQIALKQSKVLIIGAGGLGCPALIYLAASGIGNVTIVDYDDVELSNLHRQILHTELDIGRPKVQSAAEKTFLLNHHCRVTPLKLHANGQLQQLFSDAQFHVVLDCSDNVPTRYLVNDLCIFNNIPLVSGSALQMEGQLTVYNHEQGPCYRCLFPRPPPPETVTNCGDGGVLPPIPGTIGVLQALETIKILTKAPGVLSSKLLLFDGTECTFRTVKLRGKAENCAVCSPNATIQSPIDYEHFCNAQAHDQAIDIDILNTAQNVRVENVEKLLEQQEIIVDVRPEVEYDMCHLDNTYNVPFELISTGKIDGLKTLFQGKSEVYTLCRRGNDSQRAVPILKRFFPNVNVRNVIGGLRAYSRTVDSTFPVY